MGRSDELGSEERAGPVAAVLLSQRCLVVQRPAQSCRSCAVACAVGAITIAERQVTVSRETCFGCGRCEAACRLDAIEMPGADRSLPIPMATLECGRVPLMLRRTGAIAVSCLGAISEHALLKYAADGGRKLVIVDRAWCENCAVGRCAAPWHDAVDKVRSLLDAMGRAGDLQVEVLREPQPATASLPLVSVGAHAAKMSRRQIFARLLSPPVQRPAKTEADRYGVPKTVAPNALTERVASLREINSGEPLPGILFPTVSLRETCCGNLTCVAACPTAALATAKHGLSVSLSFDPALCINCGECATICPTGSLELRARGSGQYDGRRELRGHARINCAICDGEFNPDGDDARCPACRKDHGLAAAGFGLMRGRNQTPLDL